MNDRAPVRLAEPVVRDGWLLLDGCKVARVRGSVIAFHDKCRRRSSARGTDQVCVEATHLAEVINQAARHPPQNSGLTDS